MDAREIINGLGGYREVAEALNLANTRVHNWTRRGIAAQFWPDIIDLANSKGRRDITFDALKRARASDNAMPT